MMTRERDLLAVMLVVRHADPADHHAVICERCFEGQGCGVGERRFVVHACRYFVREEEGCKESESRKEVIHD